MESRMNVSEGKQITETDVSAGPWSSQPFKFVVADTAIYMHSEVVAKLSTPLKVLMMGPMCEASNRCATLQDVAVSTFKRFAEWAYTGAYNAPKYILPKTKGLDGDWTGGSAPGLSSTARRRPQGTVQFPELWSYTEASQTRTNFREEFLQLRTLLEHNTGDGEPSQGPHSTEIFSDALRPHIDLYIFADTYDIEPLKKVTARKFHEILAKYELDFESRQQFIALVQYVYENTPRRADHVVDLRTVSKYYICYDMYSFTRVPEFKEFLREDEEFLEDFLEMVAKRTAG